MSLGVNFKHSQNVLEQLKAPAAKKQVVSWERSQKCVPVARALWHSSWQWIPPEKLFHSRGNCKPRFPAHRCHFNHHAKVVNRAKRIGYNNKPSAGRAVAARSAASPWTCLGMVWPDQARGGASASKDMLCLARSRSREAQEGLTTSRPASGAAAPGCVGYQRGGSM